MMQPTKSLTMNRLCYVSGSKSRIALLKKFLDPIIRSAGAVPFWSENVVAENGVSWFTAVDAAICKSSIRIFDVTDEDRFVESELRLSLGNSAKKTIVINAAHEKKISVLPFVCEGTKIVQYSLSESDDACVQCSNWQGELKQCIWKLLGSGDEKLKQSKLARNPTSQDCDGRLIMAWVEVEKAARENGYVTHDLHNLLREVCSNDFKLRDDAYRLLSMRNYVVHGVTHATRKDVEFAQETSQRLIRKMGRG